MNSKLNIAIAASLGAAVVLIVVLMVFIKPAAKSAASDWKRTEGDKLIQEKRSAELLNAQGRVLWETAFLAKEAGPESTAVSAVVHKAVASDTTGVELTVSGSQLSFGWPGRTIHFVFANGMLKEIDLSALKGAAQ